MILLGSPEISLSVSAVDGTFCSSTSKLCVLSNYCHAPTSLTAAACTRNPRHYQQRITNEPMLASDSHTTFYRASCSKSCYVLCDAWVRCQESVHVLTSTCHKSSHSACLTSVKCLSQQAELTNLTHSVCRAPLFVWTSQKAAVIQI